jgi:hypothetical protein
MSNLDATAREIEARFFNDYVPTWVKPCPCCHGTKWEPRTNPLRPCRYCLGTGSVYCCDNPIGGADELGCGGWLERDHAYVPRQKSALPQ